MFAEGSGNSNEEERTWGPRTQELQLLRPVSTKPGHPHPSPHFPLHPTVTYHLLTRNLLGPKLQVVREATQSQGSDVLPW